MKRPGHPWLLLCISVAVSLALAEILARVLFPKVQPEDWNHTDTLDVGSSTIGGKEFEGWSNSLGLRGPEYPLEFDGYRILALGDSFTYGYMLFNENSWPMLTENVLNESYGGPYQVLNGGRPGTDTRWQADYLKEFGLKYHPDLVIVGFLINDCTTRCSNCGAVRAKTELDSHRLEMDNPFIPALYRLYRIGTLKREISQDTAQRYENSYASGSEKLLQCQDAFREIRTLSVQFGFKLMVVIYPMLYRLDSNYPFQDIHEQMLSFWQRESISAHDLTPAFTGQNDIDLWVLPTNSHPNKQANLIAANRIATLVREIAESR